MMVHPKKGFEGIVAVIDAVNPVLVLLSIVGLFFEFTGWKRYVIPVNQVIDVLFVVDFLIRLLSFPAGRYFFKGYGWIDFLASLPGLTLLLSYTPVFGAFKFVRIGRFFKIIRILRFLRVFSFLKRMRSDSVFIQERIMKIGVSVVLVFVAGIFAADTLGLASLESLKSAPYLQEYQAGAGVGALAQAHADVVYYTLDGKIYNRAGELQTDVKAYDDAVNDQVALHLEILLKPETIVSADNLRVPVEALLITAPDVEVAHDGLMLTLITTLVILLLIIMFYVGFLFAKDMKIVQLINDSLDADDYLLLNEEAKALQDEHGNLAIEEGEDEIHSLLKMVGRMTLEKADQDLSLSNPFGFSSDGEGTVDAGLLQLEARLDRIEALVETKDERLLSQKQLLTIIRETTKETLNALRKKD